MTDISINGIPHRPVLGNSDDSLSPERLRTIVRDSHLSFLIGAGTPSSFFGLLGNVEEALTELAESTADNDLKTVVRASIYAYFFDSVLVPNLKVVERHADAESVLTSYAKFLRTINRILLKRHSSILARQANIFTTNIDMVFEVAMEQMGLDFSDGFSGKIRPRFDLGDFNTIRLRMSSRFEQRSEVPVFNLLKLHGSSAWRHEIGVASADSQMSWRRRIVTFRQRSQFVLIDFNGEYLNRDASGGDNLSTSVMTSDANKREYALRTRSGSGPRLPLPSNAVSDLAFWTVLLDATEKTQAPFLARVLNSDYWDRRLADPNDLSTVLGDMVFRATKSSDKSVDRQMLLNLLAEVQTCLGSTAPQELAAVIEDFQMNLHYNATQGKFFWGEWTNYVDPDHSTWASLTKDKIVALPIDFSTIEPGIDLIRFKIVLQYYNGIISGFSNREHLSPLIKRLETRVPDIKKLITVEDDGDQYDAPLTVVSLRDVNLSMRKVIPMLLCKHLYDLKKETDPTNARYLNLIIDEAHNILSLESSRESEAWRDYRLETFEEIVKEGRKFGVFLTLASQRPHDISPTIISQLHNYFLHRLVNNLDVLAIEKAVSYLDRVSFEQLPILPRGVCVVAGVSAQVPVIVRISPLAPETEPNSRTMSIAADWLTPLEETPLSGLELPEASDDDVQTSAQAQAESSPWDSDDPPF